MNNENIDSLYLELSRVTNANSLRDITNFKRIWMLECALDLCREQVLNADDGGLRRLILFIVGQAFEKSRQLTREYENSRGADAHAMDSADQIASEWRNEMIDEMKALVKSSIVEEPMILPWEHGPLMTWELVTATHINGGDGRYLVVCMSRGDFAISKHIYTPADWDELCKMATKFNRILDNDKVMV